MTWFTDGVEMTPKREDGRCSHCTPIKSTFGSRTFKAKWKIGGADVDHGYIMEDGSAPEPLTKERYDELMKQHNNDVKAMMDSLGRVPVDWKEVCGYCKRLWEVNPNKDEWTHYSYALYCFPLGES